MPPRGEALTRIAGEGVSMTFDTTKIDEWVMDECRAQLKCKIVAREGGQ